MAIEMLDRGTGVILDAAFQRDSAEASLAPLVLRSRTVLVHLIAPLGLTDRRFRERFAKGERHPAHRDIEAMAHEGLLFEDVWPRWAQPLNLDVPTLVVDTTDHRIDDLTSILSFIRSA